MANVVTQEQSEAAKARDAARRERFEFAVAVVEREYKRLLELLPCPDFGRMPEVPKDALHFYHYPLYGCREYDEADEVLTRWTAEYCDQDLERRLAKLEEARNQLHKHMAQVRECTTCWAFFRCATLSGRLGQ